jgi:hypothetical protein
MKHPIGEKIFLIIGWIAISPFVLSEYIIQGVKWIVKNKKKKLIRPLNLKSFPGYDFYFMLLIVLFIVVLATCSGCYSPDTVYVREHYQPRPFGTSLYIHHDHHYDHHNDHYRHSNRRSDRPARKAPTVSTRNPSPPPSRPISKGISEPPRNPRDRR